MAWDEQFEMRGVRCVVRAFTQTGAAGQRRQGAPQPPLEALDIAPATAHRGSDDMISCVFFGIMLGCR